MRVDQQAAPRKNARWITFGMFTMIIGAGIAWGVGGCLFASGLWITLDCFVEDLSRERS